MKRAVPLAPGDVLLRDGENHHQSGVHDANGNPGEPNSRVGDVSPVVGKMSGITIRSFALDNAAPWRGGSVKITV